MKEKISTHQFMIVSAGVFLGTTFFRVAQIVAQQAGRDGWWAILPSYSAAIPLALMIMSLKKDYPEQNLLEISEAVLGKWVGKGIGVLYIGISVYFGALLLAQVGDTFRRTVLPLVPNYMFEGGVILLVFFLAWGGIEVYSRFNEVVFPLIFIGLLMTLFLALPRFEWNEFFPVLAEGIKPVFFAALRIAPFGMEYILFFAGVLPFLPTDKEGHKQIKASGYRAIILVVVLETLTTLTELLVFGPGEAKRINYGLLTLGNMIEVARTIAGTESILMIIWMGAMIIKVGAFYFMAMWGLQTVFKVKDELKWYLILSAVFFWIADSRLGGTWLVLELAATDFYLLMPFTIVWVVLLWGLRHIKKGLGK